MRKIELDELQNMLQGHDEAYILGINAELSPRVYIYGNERDGICVIDHCSEEEYVNNKSSWSAHKTKEVQDTIKSFN